MAQQNILLGGIVKDEVAKVNANFTELYTDMPTKTSDLTNDSNFVTSTQMTSAIGAIEIPSKTSDLTNDSNFATTQNVADAVANKVDKVNGKDLSTNDYSDADKAKVDKLGKIDFTASDFTTSSGYQVATISAAGKYPVKVMRQNGSTYEEVIAQTAVSGNNIIITASEAFAGYVVTI